MTDAPRGAPIDATPVRGVFFRGGGQRRVPPSNARTVSAPAPQVAEPDKNKVYPHADHHRHPRDVSGPRLRRRHADRQPRRAQREGRKEGRLPRGAPLVARLVALALVFDAWLSWYVDGAQGREAANRIAAEFFTGYLIEKSLAVDNIFVFLMLFTAFGVPAIYQRRVLVLGVIGAIVLRAVMILIGASLLAKFHWILYVFGAFLLLTGVKMLFSPRPSRTSSRTRCCAGCAGTSPSRRPTTGTLRREQDGAGPTRRSSS